MADNEKQFKFDVIIGNPPYQEERQGTSKTALPIYNYFMDNAYQIGKIVELITPARFLFNAGRTPKTWNKKMLNDPHLKVLYFEKDASKVFDDTEIKGGVAVTYRDNNKDFGAIEIFTAYEQVNSILKKISMGAPFSKKAFVATKFDTTNLFQDYPQYENHERRMSSNVLNFDCFHEEIEEDDIQIYGILNGNRTFRNIKKWYVDGTDENIKKYKIITPKANEKGEFGEKLANPQIIGPNSGFTHTFLGIGGFNSREEAENALKYIKTKFARTLLSILKVTQDLNAGKWKYVPLQDFTQNSDIDWTKTIPEIDQQLYKKYGLSGEEINFIETKVKEMD